MKPTRWGFFFQGLPPVLDLSPVWVLHWFEASAFVEHHECRRRCFVKSSGLYLLYVRGIHRMACLHEPIMTDCKNSLVIVDQDRGFAINQGF